MTYHPHGTSAGQIGHNANIDTGLTPGSDGGKFIGFGEDGTSSIGNRAHWALSENIDHVYQEVHREIAIPKGYNRTAGAVESSFQFPSGEEIWTGDTTYPGVAGTSDPEGMQMLFDVLDSNYNELTDSSDNEIRVGMVKESAGVTDIYQGGFQDQPRIYFVAVDPLTGVVVTDPYTIPAATNYKVMCGIKSTVAELPADALIRYKVQGASEVEAGTFLQDGSRPMTGDLDIDGNNILNVDVLSNVISEPLDITSDDDLLFKDQYLATSLALSEAGQTSLYQPVAATIHPSLVGAINASSEVQEIMLGNRCIDKTGSIVTTDEDIVYPELKVMLQGQTVTIPAGSILDTAVDGSYVIYVTPDGTLNFELQAVWESAVNGSVPIWRGQLTGTTWSVKKDLRWPSTRRGDYFSIYVGSGMGADFASITDAIDWVSYAGAGLDTFKSPIDYEIVIVGESVATETVVLPAGWTLRGVTSRGEGDQSVITTLGVDAASHVIDAGANCVVKDLKIVWLGDTDQDSAYGGVRLATNSRAENLLFALDAGEVFGNNIVANGAADSVGPVIRGCTFSGFANAGISAAGQGRVHIENCAFTGGEDSDYHINLAPTNAVGDATSPAHTIVGCYFKDRPDVANIQIGGPNVSIDSCHGNLASGSDSPFVQIISAGSIQNKAGAIIRNCLLESGYTALKIAINNSSLRLSVLVEGCNFVEFTGTCIDLACASLHSSSLVEVDGNCFKGHTSFSEIAIATNVSSMRISNNKFYAYIWYCVHVDSAGKYVSDLRIVNNEFTNCCWKQLTVGAYADAQASVIMLEADKALDESISEIVISGNLFSTITGSAVRGHGDVAGVTISSNSFHTVKGIYLYDDGGAAKADKYAVIAMDTDGGGSGWDIANNRFTECGDEYDIEVAPLDLVCHIIYLNSTAGGAPVIIDGNEFGDSIASGATADVNDLWRTIGAYADTDVVCSNNTFYRDIGNYRPRYGFSFIMLSGASMTMSGCTFRLIGAATGLLSNVQCVTGSGTLVATGCYTYCDFSTNFPEDRMWNGVIGGIVVGCYFKGGTTYASPANTVYLALGAGGMVACNVFSGTGTVTRGDNPVGYLPAFNPEV